MHSLPSSLEPLLPCENQALASRRERTANKRSRVDFIGVSKSPPQRRPQDVHRGERSRARPSILGEQACGVGTPWGADGLGNAKGRLRMAGQHHGTRNDKEAGIFLSLWKGTAFLEAQQLLGRNPAFSWLGNSKSSGVRKRPPHNLREEPMGWIKGRQGPSHTQRTVTRAGENVGDFLPWALMVGYKWCHCCGKQETTPANPQKLNLKRIRTIRPHKRVCIHLQGSAIHVAKKWGGEGKCSYQQNMGYSYKNIIQPQKATK